MSRDAGYILLFRSVQEHWLFRERRSFSRFEAWVDLLFLAAYTNHKLTLKGELYELKRGDVLWSQRELARKWLWSEKKLRGFLEMLERDGMIRTQSSPRKVTQITICNYDRYQLSGRREYSSEGRSEDAAGMQESRRTNKGKEGKERRTSILSVTAERIYHHYEQRVRDGNKAESLEAITTLLQNHPEGDLIGCIDRYAGNGMKADKEFRYRPHNFFGHVQHFKKYLSSPGNAQAKTVTVTDTQRFFKESKGEKE